jgi:hypothetical protein
MWVHPPLHDRAAGDDQGRDRDPLGTGAAAIHDDVVGIPRVASRPMSLIREESLKAIGGEVNDIALQGLDIELHGRTLADVI